jgi:hypothetical protein
VVVHPDCQRLTEYHRTLQPYFVRVFCFLMIMR